MKRWALAAAAVAATGMTMMGMQPVGAAAHTVGSGDIIPWALAAENPNANTAPVPLAQAKIDAGNFNLIIAHAIQYSGEVTAMKAVNKNLKILMYMNATFAQSSTTVPPGGNPKDFSQCLNEANAFPASEYLYSSATQTPANEVINPASGNCLMDPTNASWIANRVTMCETEAKAAGYDGCYLDDLGLGPLKTSYLNALPYDTKTHATWTPPNWLAATASLAAGVHAKASTLKPTKLLVYGNGLTDGPSWFNSKTSTIMTVGKLDGGIAEGWIRQAPAPGGTFPTAANWLLNVNMIGAVEKLGKPLLTLTKCWGPTSPPAPCSAAQDTQWLQYTLSSFLLGTGGKSQFFFSPSQSTLRTSTFPLYGTALGAPSGAMVKGSTGYYTRKFATGLVAVNPGTATVTVTSAANLFASAGCPGFAVKTKVPAGGLSMPKDTGCILTTS